MPTTGIDNAAYETRGSAAAKASMFLWLLSGLIFNWYHSHLLSFSSLLIFVPGIFVAALIAMPVFWFDLYKERILLDQRARALAGRRRAFDWVLLVLFTPWWVISQIWPIGLAVLAAKLLNRMGM